jgi:hypothetical protein
MVKVGYRLVSVGEIKLGPTADITAGLNLRRKELYMTVYDLWLQEKVQRNCIMKSLRI